MYGSLPQVIGQFNIKGSELQYYQYLPIKFSSLENHKYAYGHFLEKRLQNNRGLLEILHKIKEDYSCVFGEQDYNKSYVYLTFKRLYQKCCGFNRQGWHSDNFGDDCITYLFSDCQPTVFNTTKIFLSKDDELCLIEMQKQIDEKNNITYPNNTLLRLDQYVIHRVAKPIEGVRTFLKVSISKDRYNLEGNSMNYLLDYNWDLRKRNKERNIPQDGYSR